MRVLALDYGSAQCGCALCDPSGTIVTPIAAVAHQPLQRAQPTPGGGVREREVERVVVGLPLSLRGHDTAQTRETRAFAERLAGLLGEAVQVEMLDERLTTRLAQRTPGARNTSEHSRAAAHLLEGWLTSRAR